MNTQAEILLYAFWHPVRGFVYVGRTEQPEDREYTHRRTRQFNGCRFRRLRVIRNMRDARRIERQVITAMMRRGEPIRNKNGFSGKPRPENYKGINLPGEIWMLLKKNKEETGAGIKWFVINAVKFALAKQKETGKQFEAVKD